jgi:dynein heavy chain
MDFVDALPALANPEVFGLHENAAITRDQAEANKLFDSLLLTLSSGGGGGGGGGGGAKKVKTRDETIAELVGDMLARLKPEYDMEYVNARYPVDPKESMNTVLVQELARYNRLLGTIKYTLDNVQKAMKGLVLLNASLESVASDVFLGRVPEVWKPRSFASRKPLAAYFSELCERTAVLDAWIEKGPPDMFWIVGFFFPQSFLTGVSQNFARTYTIPVDDVVFDYEPLPEAVTRETVTKANKPADGVYTYGTWLEGARWNFASKPPKVGWRWNGRRGIRTSRSAWPLAERGSAQPANG